MNDLETTESLSVFDAEFRTELIQATAISLAATVGMVAGFVLVGQAIITVGEIKAKRAAKKAAKTN